MTEARTERRERRVALIIDADNATPKLIDRMLAEAAKQGAVTIRRIYGDWTKPNMTGWKDILNDHAIQPIQQFRYTVGKNATDSAMIIDAMDILHANVVDAFCIVSSDSDYTRLATRIRESGFFVMGIGEKKTPRPFVNGCNVFVYTENLVATAPIAAAAAGPAKDAKASRAPAKGKSDAKAGASVATAEVQAASAADGKEDTRALDPLLLEAFDMAVGEDGWAPLGVIGNYLHRLDPGFDPRSYGFRQLSQLIRSRTELLETKADPDHALLVRARGERA